MVRYLFIALIAGLGLSVSTPFADARAEGARVCGAHNAIVEALTKSYAEKPAAMGLSANGSMIEVFVSTRGSFTIVMTRPNGVSCLVTAGEGWENVNMRLSDLAT